MPDPPNPGTRPDRNAVSNKDLELLALRIDHKLDKIDLKVDQLQEKHLEQDRRHAEVAAFVQTGRDVVMDHANRIQVIDDRTSPMTRDMHAEVATLLPNIRSGVEFLDRWKPEAVVSTEEQQELREIIHERAQNDKEAFAIRIEHQKADIFAKRQARIVISGIIISPLASALILHFLNVIH